MATECLSAHLSTEKIKNFDVVCDKSLTSFLHASSSCSYLNSFAVANYRLFPQQPILVLSFLILVAPQLLILILHPACSASLRASHWMDSHRTGQTPRAQLLLPLTSSISPWSRTRPIWTSRQRSQPSPQCWLSWQKSRGSWKEFFASQPPFGGCFLWPFAPAEDFGKRDGLAFLAQRAPACIRYPSLSDINELIIIANGRYVSAQLETINTFKTKQTNKRRIC